jgi:hypothetical protein
MAKVYGIFFINRLAHLAILPSRSGNRHRSQLLRVTLRTVTVTPLTVSQWQCCPY